MRFLALISWIVILISCASNPYQHLITTRSRDSCLYQFRPEFKTILYNTQINIINKHLSGLLFFKSISDTVTRVVFTNEMGLKYFDFEYTSNTFNVHYCIRQLNKKKILHQLRDDIGMILLFGISGTPQQTLTLTNELYLKFPYGKEKLYYVLDSACTRLIRIEKASAKKKKVITNLGPYKNGLPDSIYVNYQTFRFNIRLKQIDR
jgi:hypothetical protein